MSQLVRCLDILHRLLSQVQTLLLPSSPAEREAAALTMRDTATKLAINLSARRAHTVSAHEGGSAAAYSYDARFLAVEFFYGWMLRERQVPMPGTYPYPPPPKPSLYAPTSPLGALTLSP